jgi:hypothetical protein
MTLFIACSRVHKYRDVTRTTGIGKRFPVSKMAMLAPPGVGAAIPFAKGST